MRETWKDAEEGGQARCDMVRAPRYRAWRIKLERDEGNKTDPPPDDARPTGAPDERLHAS